MIAIISILILINANLAFGQYQQTIQIEYKGEKYWKFENQDSVYSNTPFLFFTSYDSNGKDIGHDQIFPHDGKWIQFYLHDSTKVACIFEVLDSLVDGILTTYYPNGQMELEVQMKKNELSGYWKHWYRNGQISLISEYKLIDNGYFYSSVQTGKWESWYQNGALKGFKTYFDGNLYGPLITYYPDHNIKSEEYYSDDQLDGIYITYHSNRQVHKSYIYKNGRLISKNPNIEYHPNGKISAIGNYDGLKVGKWKYYYFNGNIKSKGAYKLITIQTPHGDVVTSMKYGKWEYYYSNGSKMAIGKYGEPYIFDDSKTIRNNKWKYYNSDGKLIDRKIFDSLGIEITEQIDYDD